MFRGSGRRGWREAGGGSGEGNAPLEDGDEDIVEILEDGTQPFLDDDDSWAIPDAEPAPEPESLADKTQLVYEDPKPDVIDDSLPESQLDYDESLPSCSMKWVEALLLPLPP